eukprot:gene6834-7549_t
MSKEGVKRKKRGSLYKEASSDDEFAREFLIFPSSSSSGSDSEGKKRGRGGKKKKKNDSGTGRSRSSRSQPQDLDGDTGTKQTEEVIHANEGEGGGYSVQSFFTPRTKKTQQESAKNKKNKKDHHNDDEEEEDDDEVKYRIQHILACRSMTASAWREITDKMTTREITKGSVLQQPDDEYYDLSNQPVEKFLIKWIHASYLHVSWETEKDLYEILGNPTIVKMQLKKFRQREVEGTELFDDLSKGECFPPAFLLIDRVLDVDDPDVDKETIDWEHAAIPPLLSLSSLQLLDDNNEEEKDDEEEEVVMVVEEEEVEEEEMNLVSGNDDNNVVMNMMVISRS